MRAALDKILSQLVGVKQTKPNQWMCCCPAHKGGKEANQSFAVSIKPDGRILINCHTACEPEDVLAALDNPPITFRDLAPDNEDGKSGKSSRTRRETSAPVPDHHLSLDECEQLCAKFSKTFAEKESARLKLALALDLPLSCFDQLAGIGAHTDHPRGPCWTFPERNAQGQVCGFSLRFADKFKPTFPKSKRGLTIPLGWKDRPGPIYLVEGASDTLALTAANIAAIGRPSVNGGISVLAEFIKANVPAERKLVWVVENDNDLETRKKSQTAASKLAAMIERKLYWCAPPTIEKDMRGWITGLAKDSVQWEHMAQRTADNTKHHPVKPAIIQKAKEETSEPAKETSENPPPNGTTTAPTATDSEDNRHIIRLGRNDEMPINDDAIAQLCKDPEVFARGDFLVTVIDEPAEAYRGCNFPPGPRIVPIEFHVLRERLGSLINFIAKREGKDVKVLPPERVVSTIRGRRVWPGMRCLESVVEYPILRRDGTISSKPGYDESTGTYYAAPSEIPIVPENPTPADAVEAWNALQEMICDFPFVGDAHKASWLAAFLTPLARFAFRGAGSTVLAGSEHAGNR